MTKSKRQTVSEWTIAQESAGHEALPVTIELSAHARANLEKLQLRSLDRQGRQPGPSQVIEWLINAAAIREPDAHYPA